MGSEVPTPDREAVAAADQARQDHRGRGAEPDRAGEPARHRQRQPRDHARQPHAAAAGRARRLHGGARRHAGQPCRSARHAAGGAHARAGRRLLRAPGAVRRLHAALDGRPSTTRSARRRARSPIAMENHVRALSDTLGQQANNLDESMMHGIDAVRRTSDSVTRQSLKAIEGLSSQADLLKNVSENLVQQISGVTNRFDNQGQSIVNAASALEIGQLAHRLHPAEAPRRAQRHPAAPRPARPTSSTRSCAATRKRWRARWPMPRAAPAAVTQSSWPHGRQRPLASCAAELERLRSQTDAQAMRARGHARRRCPASRRR